MKVVKEWVCRWVLPLMDFNDERIGNNCIDYDAWDDVEEAPPLKHPCIFWLSRHVGNLLGAVWSWSFEGSEDELEMAIGGEIPVEYQDARLRKRVCDELRGREEEFYDYEP
jgi:hypothetical protein